MARFLSSATTNAIQTRRDIYQVYRTQFLNAANGAKRILNQEIDQIYANGKPSANDFATLQGLVNGLSDAATFQLSSHLSLLPAATDKLVAQVQQGMLADNGRSLVQRLNAIIGTARFNRSADSLKAAINQTITNFTKMADRQLLNYLNTTPINRLSVDSTLASQAEGLQPRSRRALEAFQCAHGDESYGSGFERAPRNVRSSPGLNRIPAAAWSRESPG